MKREALIMVGLVGITLLAFKEIGNCQFVNFDDIKYIIENPHVTRGLSVTNFTWAWKTFYQGNYIPLTWLSLMLDATLFGPGPHGFHWVNLGIHAANAVLVYLFFRQATGAVWRSALVAAVFAVHPLRVESVAWVVERKDVLTGFFWLLTLLAYLRFARGLEGSWYVITLLSFAAALLAKQTLATLPFLLLLLDYWPLGRWVRGPAAVAALQPPRMYLWQLILEKLPLLVMSAAIISVTIHAQASSHSISTLQKVPWAYRLTNAPISYVRYLGKMVWFADLAVLYPQRPFIRSAWSILNVAGACLLLLAITGMCLWKLRSRPWLTIGWLWFLGVLVPMIGVIQFGPQAMADRFTYVSGIGLLIMLAWSIPREMSDRPVMVVAAVGTPLALLIVFTIAQTRYWRDSVTLFSHDIDVAGSNWIAELNLGSALRNSGDLPDAISHLRKAEKLNPGKANIHGALAMYLEESSLKENRHSDEALVHAGMAIQEEPKIAEWHIVRGWLLLNRKQNDEAETECRTAVALNPQSAEAHHRLGVTLCEMGKMGEGIDQLKKALAIMPEMKQAQKSLQQYQNR